MVTVPVEVLGWASLPETLPGQNSTMTATASKAAPVPVQPFRGSKTILCVLIMAGISGLGVSLLSWTVQAGKHHASLLGGGRRTTAWSGWPCPSIGVQNLSA